MNFSGYHCYKILENVDLKKIFGNSLANENDQFNVENVNSFWKNLFYTFISFLYDSSLVQRETNNWLNNFLLIYNEKYAVPYLHIFTCHLHEMYKMHKEINFFNVQGLEKSNHLIKLNLNRATNCSNKSLKQILEKVCRIDQILSVSLKSRQINDYLMIMITVKNYRNYFKIKQLFIIIN